MKSSDKFGILLVVLTSLAGFVFLANISSSGESITLGRQKFSVRIADDEEERERGLSGTNQLGQNEGMLFVFKKTSKYCFWMKDMNYHLDILWLDNNKKIIHIEQNASPDSYPKNFCPPSNSMFVVEVPVGTVAKHGLRLQDMASF